MSKMGTRCPQRLIFASFCVHCASPLKCILKLNLSSDGCGKISLISSFEELLS